MFSEVKFQKFPAQMSKRFKKKCTENISDWSSGEAKCSFDNNAEKISAEVLRFYSLTSELIKNIFLTEFRFTIKWSIVQIECGFDKRTRNFRRIRKIWGSKPKKFISKFCFIREPFSLKMSLCTRGSQSWQLCRNFFGQKSVFFA